MVYTYGWFYAYTWEEHTATIIRAEAAIGLEDFTFNLFRISTQQCYIKLNKLGFWFFFGGGGCAGFVST